MDSATHATGIRLFLAREKLIEDWMTRVLADPRIPSAHRVLPFELRDYVPRFIDIATETLRASAFNGEVRMRAASFARVHALERLTEDFTLDEVQREFDHLEEVVGEYLQGVGERRLLLTALGEAREIAARAYAEQSGARWKEERDSATVAKTLADDDGASATNAGPSKQAAS